jgi:hypothetical protein
VQPEVVQPEEEYNDDDIDQVFDRLATSTKSPFPPRQPNTTELHRPPPMPGSASNSVVSSFSSRSSQNIDNDNDNDNDNISKLTDDNEKEDDEDGDEGGGGSGGYSFHPPPRQDSLIRPTVSFGTPNQTTSFNDSQTQTPGTITADRAKLDRVRDLNQSMIDTIAKMRKIYPRRNDTSTQSDANQDDDNISHIDVGSVDRLWSNRSPQLTPPLQQSIPKKPLFNKPSPLIERMMTRSMTSSVEPNSPQGSASPKSSTLPTAPLVRPKNQPKHVTKELRLYLKSRSRLSNSKIESLSDDQLRAEVEKISKK